MDEKAAKFMRSMAEFTVLKVQLFHTSFFSHLID